MKISFKQSTKVYHKECLCNCSEWKRCSTEQIPVKSRISCRVSHQRNVYSIEWVLLILQSCSVTVWLTSLQSLRQSDYSGLWTSRIMNFSEDTAPGMMDTRSLLGLMVSPPEETRLWGENAHNLFILVFIDMSFPTDKEDWIHVFYRFSMTKDM